jgi:hypothetical protein
MNWNGDGYRIISTLMLYDEFNPNANRLIA